MSRVTIEFNPDDKADAYAAGRAIAGTIQTYGEHTVEFVPVPSGVAVDQTGAQPAEQQPAVDTAPADAPVEPAAPEAPAEQPAQ